jgi:hypothetical protein
MTLLMAACRCNRIDIVAYLLSTITDDELCYRNGDNLNALFFVSTPQVFDMLIAKAKEFNCSNRLVRQISSRYNTNVLSKYIFDGKHELIKYVLNQYPDDVVRQCDVRIVLSSANDMYWTVPENQHIWTEVSQLIKTHYANEIQCTPASIAIQPSTYSLLDSSRMAYPLIFNKNFEQFNLTKNAALEFCYAQITVIFKSQLDLCIPYLSYLSKQLEAYFLQKHKVPFPRLRRDQINFKPINEYYYPIPASTDYQGIKKHSALQEYLLGLFQQYDMGKQAAKWIGFIPPEHAEAWIFQTNFFTEERRGEGLTHEKMENTNN